jgi:hypothetical protein
VRRRLCSSRLTAKGLPERPCHHSKLVESLSPTEVEAGAVDLTVFLALIAEPGVQRESAVMNATLEDVTKKKPEPTAEAIAAEEIVRRARGAGPVSDRSGRAAETADQDGAGDHAEPGDDRAPRP